MPEINSLIISHQSRMLCILSKLFPKMNGGNTVRFMNCATVKVCLRFNLYSKQWDLIADLVYDGEIGENEKKADYIYFTNNSDIKQLTPTEKYLLYPFNQQLCTSLNVLKELKVDTLESPGCTVDIHTVYNFFIIRHGQALHNTYKGHMQKAFGSMSKYNTELTDTIGPQQAKNAAQYMNDHNIFPKIFHYVFVSDLFRTHQTLAAMGVNRSPITATKDEDKKDFSKAIIPMETTPIMLPCNHEITGKCSTCDGCKELPAGENQTDDKSFKNTFFNVDTSYYNEFYNGRRSIFSKTRERCADNNFIGTALAIIVKCRKNDAQQKEFQAQKKLALENYLSRQQPAAFDFGGKSRKKRRRTKKYTYKL